jgi:mersacidin/lichenicidin family type 2 lantibiotic
VRFDVIRAWKDADYRASLSPEEQAALPENPIGDAKELSDDELDEVTGNGFIWIGGGWCGGGRYYHRSCHCCYDHWYRWDDWGCDWDC